MTQENESVVVQVSRVSPGGTNLPLPMKATAGAAGVDLVADAIALLRVGKVTCVPTGIMIAIPQGWEGQVRARSGLAKKYGIALANGVGTIDSDYRGELTILLINLGNKDLRIARGDRIAQLILAPVVNIEWQETETLTETVRGKNGFGSTGRK